MSVWTIVVAAGFGSRFGGDKVNALLGGERVVQRSVRTAAAASDGVVVVIAGPPTVTADELGVDSVVIGGASRSASVRAGLAAVPLHAECIMVHDAARPLASPALFRAVIEASATADGALPGLPIADTVKRVSTKTEGFVRVHETVDRSQLMTVQTPQAFRADVFRAAHATAHEATDDAALIEAAGGIVVVVPGEISNRKITVPDDLRFLEAQL